jgi:alpha/beta superfamily hydrolase
MLLAGWSFGADMALATSDRRVAGWLAIAPPLRSSDRFDIVARDHRPKHLVLGQHDEIRAPESIVSDIENWNETTVDVIPGASHFFVGRTDRVVDAAVSFVERLAASA